MSRVGLEPGELAVAEHATGEQTGTIEGNQNLNREVCKRGGQSVGHPAQGYTEQPERDVRVVPGDAVEAQDEAEQIQAQGNHPQKWNRSDILGDVVRDGEQEC